MIAPALEYELLTQRTFEVVATPGSVARTTRNKPQREGGKQL
jgi:hypothetical protein